MILVKCGRLNSESKEYSLSSDASIEKLLSVAGLRKKDTEVITVNGDELDEDEAMGYTLEDGDRVLLVRNIEGA